MIGLFLQKFYEIFGNWQMIGLSLVMLLLLFRSLNREYYEKLLGMFPWEKRWILIAVSVLVIIQLREIYGYPLIWIQTHFPTYNLAECLIFYIGNIHLRSILFYSMMILWLWKKMKALFPALISGFFWIGLIELSFIPQHWIWLNYFMGWNHYLPFILIMTPFIFERKRFFIPRNAWMWFLGGVALQYICLPFSSWSVMILDQRGFGFFVNPLAFPHPEIQNYLWEFGQHLLKTLFTIAGAKTLLRSNIDPNKKNKIINNSRTIDDKSSRTFLNDNVS